MIVTAWPLDGTAARRLSDYAAKRESGSRDVLDGRDLDFRGADLSSVDLEGACVMRATLDGVNFRGAVLSDADLTDASAAGTCFDGAEVMGAEFAHVNARAASFADAELGGLNALESDFSSANFCGANLRGAVFLECVLTGADLRGTLLSRTKFRDSRLDGIQVSGAAGTVIGPSEIAEGVVLDGQELEQWFRDRGADIKVVPGDPRQDTITPGG
ncbi:MAG: pentapeptide repeat-containing protein [Micromonosporaceae bacterium]